MRPGEAGSIDDAGQAGDRPAPRGLRRAAADLPHRAARYLRLHWTGRLSLAVSLGVNGLFLTAAIALFLRFGIGDRAQALGLVEMAVAFAAIWVGVLTLTLWQSVGVWRSALRHAARGGSRVFAAIARALAAFWLVQAVVVFGAIGAPHARALADIALGDPGVPAAQVRTGGAGGGGMLDLEGGITYGLAQAIEAALDRAPGVETVRLDSPGGRLGPAARLSDTVRRRGLTTYTEKQCASACTVVFLGAERRYIAPDARLGFHHPNVIGGMGSLAPGFHGLREFYRAAGVAEWFIDRVFATPSTEMWYPTTDELIRAGVVTGVVAR